MTKLDQLNQLKRELENAKAVLITAVSSYTKGECSEEWVKAAAFKVNKVNEEANALLAALALKGSPNLRLVK